jgi:hypothetical protein
VRRRDLLVGHLTRAVDDLSTHLPVLHDHRPRWRMVHGTNGPPAQGGPAVYRSRPPEIKNGGGRPVDTPGTDVYSRGGFPAGFLEESE